MHFLPSHHPRQVILVQFILSLHKSNIQSHTWIIFERFCFFAVNEILPGHAKVDGEGEELTVEELELEQQILKVSQIYIQHDIVNCKHIYFPWITQVAL